MEKPEFEFPPWLNNKKFIGTALRQQENDASIVVKDVAFTSVGGKRGKLASEFHRVTITYKCTGSEVNKKQLIVKSLSTNENARKFLLKWRYFEREIHMYEAILPAMYLLVPRIVSKHLLPVDPLPLSPRYYPSPRPHTVVLDDLSSEGYQLCSKKLGMDHGHASLALQGMAKFHALSLVLYQKAPDYMDMFKENFFIESNREEIRELVDQPFTDLSNEVATWEGYEHFSDKLRAIPVVDRVIEAMTVNPGALAVLNHGDFWTSNMMFQYNKSGEAIAVKFIDYQQCRFVSPALDILYFMFSTPSEVVRDSFWDTFLDVYLKAFSNTLKLARADPNQLTVEQLTADIQDKMYYGLLVACTKLPLTLAALESPGQDVANVYAGARFQKAFKKLLNFFEKRGILN